MPEIGRFISQDPIAGFITDPLTLNAYPYVLNNPNKYIDPSGETAVDEFAPGLGSGGGGAVDLNAIINATLQGLGIAGIASSIGYEKEKRKLNENKVNQRSEPKARTKEQTQDTGYLNPAGINVENDVPYYYNNQNPPSGNNNNNKNNKNNKNKYETIIKYGAGTSVAIVLGDAVTTFVKNTWK
jgi:hypothetical protein